LLLAAESALILKPGAVGIGVEVEGPVQLLLRAAQQDLPSLLLRVAAVYLVAGALLGTAAAALACCFKARPRRAFIALWAVELLGLFLLVAWHRLVSRPALFDDVIGGSLVFEWLLNHGSPRHPQIALMAVLGLHAAAAVRKSSAIWRPALAAVAALAVVGVASRWPTRAQPKNPLIVLVGIDAFRPDRLSAYGGSGEVAPRLEELVRDATLFDNAYTPLAQTEPAWRSLLTARWPHRTGVRYPLTAERYWTPGATFAQELGRIGYSTAFHTDCSRFNFQGPASGFEIRVLPPGGAINFILEKLRFRALGMFADNRLGAWWVPEFIDNRAIAGIHDPIGYAERLGDSLARLSNAGPALFAYHATAAHFPGDPVYPFYRRFVDPAEPVQRRTRMFFSPIPAKPSEQWNRRGSEALYDELLSQADAQLGILIDALKRRGLYDEALIVVFSDHGESFHGDRPELAGATPVHGARLTEEENRILLAIKLPAGRRGTALPTRVADLVRLIDVGPTLLEVSGAAPLLDVDGISLVPLLEGRRMPALKLLAETGFTHARPNAFDPSHISLAPRSLDAYETRPDGKIEVSARVHEAIMREKDVGAFDGRSWIIRSRDRDGNVVKRCRGECNDDGLARWLDEVAPILLPAGS
jgi:arylsulfatase A-like enzyme